MTLCGYSAFILRESQLKQKTKKKTNSELYVYYNVYDKY